ncbi:hypothetical protein L0F63_002261, partial [Massospora cicadina]
NLTYPTAGITPSEDYLLERLTKSLSVGPDASSSTRVIYTSRARVGAGCLQLGFWGHTLFLRGVRPTPQPLSHPVTSDVLCWNGEVFGGLQVEPQANDGIVVLDRLAGLKTHAEICAFLNALKGPHAFVFYKVGCGSSGDVGIWVSDIALWHSNAGVDRLLGGRPRDGLFRKGLAWDPVFTASRRPSRYPLPLAGPRLRRPSPSPILNGGLGSGRWVEVEPALSCIDLEAVACAANLETFEPFITVLGRNEPKPTAGPIPPHLAIILSEPAFQLRPQEGGGSAGEVFRAHLADEAFLEAVNGFERVLEEAVRLRVVSIPRHGKPSLNRSATGAARLAVLFSGGVDCTVLAYYAHPFVPAGEPIDLLNVSFENPRVAAASLTRGHPVPPAPDRVTGLASLAELRRLCPGRVFRFVAIDVPFAEVEEHRHHLQVLLHPNVTEMDLSIAMAFWFAARGRGTDGVSGEGYTSEARVLLSGLGADEQLGGYSRHRSAYQRRSVQGLMDEIQLDVARLAKRNLGRDDRAISDRGKEARYPYLDSDVVAYLNQLPVQRKAGLHLESGVGDKLLLRVLASKAGFEFSASARKRAVQFGARTAKMRVGEAKLKGSDPLRL